MMSINEYIYTYGLDEKPFYTCVKLGLYLWIRSNGIEPIKKWKDPTNENYTIWRYEMTPELQKVLYEYFIEGKRYDW